MSTNKTPNYALHAWVKGDKFLMDEMNENFAKLDEKLKAGVDGLNTAIADEVAQVKTTIDAKADAATVTGLDTTVKGLQTTVNAKVPLAGGTMTGLLTLSGDPTAVKHAATKQYVDNQLKARGKWVTGSYKGNGAGTQTIDLGSTIRAVVVEDYLARRATYSGPQTFGGLVIPGASLFVNQFSIQGSKLIASIQNQESHTNDSGVTYYYLAWVDAT